MASRYRSTAETAGPAGHAGTFQARDQSRLKGTEAARCGGGEGREAQRSTSPTRVGDMMLQELWNEVDRLHRARIVHRDAGRGHDGISRLRAALMAPLLWQAAEYAPAAGR